jgi:alkaline phosphatase
MYRDSAYQLSQTDVPNDLSRRAGQDTDGDGYPENREVNGKGRKRIAVGLRTGGHAVSSLPITAEGPGAALFMGYMDQTDIFFRSAQALSMDLKALDKLVDATHSLQAH